MNPMRRFSAFLAGGDVPIAIAIALSAAAHALLVLAVPAPLPHIDFLQAQAAPPALVVRIVNPVLPPETGGHARPRIDMRKPLVPASEARTESPAANLEEAMPVVPEPAPAPAPVPVEPATYAGVNIADVTFRGPLPPRATNFEGSDEYVRETELEEPPVAVTLAVPEYPSVAAKNRTGGTVLVALYVDEEGRVVHAAAIEASEEVHGVAKGVAEALAHSVFTPGKRDGKPVKSLIFQAVRLDPAIPAPEP